jgi:LysM repeat protein
MENDTPPNETGGLKLVTVFIAVLALHVLVIGGISVYNLLKTPDLDAASLDYTRAQRPDPAAYETHPSGQESEPLYQEPAPALDTPPSSPPIQTAQASLDFAPSFDARLAVPEPPAPASSPEIPATTLAQVPASMKPTPAADPNATSSFATMTPATQEPPIPYTPSLSDGVPPGYAGVQDPFTNPSQTAPEQTLASTAFEQALAQQSIIASSSDAITHEVKPGETLGKIRALYGVSLAEIMAWNNIKDANRIRAGQKLTIQRTQTATVPAPDTSGSHAVAPEAASKARDKVATAKAKKKVVPSSVAVHRVSQGDTLYSIARKYDTTVDKIIAVNPDQLSDPRHLRVGMRLALPAHHVAKKNKKSTSQISGASSSIPISADIVMR